jgi:hypothetical protein
MTPNPCPTCGGPLLPPDDFCQRCLDAEMAARRKGARGFPEGMAWYRKSVPYLGVALLCCLLQAGVFELVTRPVVKRQLDKAEATVKAENARRKACERRNEQQYEDWWFRNQQCVTHEDYRKLDRAKYEVTELRNTPTHFYVYLAILGLSLLGLTRWASRRPLPPSILAAVLTFSAVLIVSFTAEGSAGWVPLYCLMGATLLASGVASWNAIKHARD